MTDAERQRALDAIAAEVATCTRCRLHETRTRSVPGEGSAETEVVFVGEGPGFNEDRQGRPFVGQAGSLLTDLLTSVGWARSEVFITNVVKCRPPGNRDPEQDEMAACAPYLSRQLAVLDPALVVTLGRFSMGRFMPGARIGAVHGTYRQADADSGAPEALAYAMYHPAAALHQGSLKETLFADMAGVPHALIASRKRRATAGGAETLAPEPDVETGATVEEVPEAEKAAPDDLVAEVEAASATDAIDTVAPPEPSPEPASERSPDPAAEPDDADAAAAEIADLAASPPPPGFSPEAAEPQLTLF